VLTRSTSVTGVLLITISAATAAAANRPKGSGAQFLDAPACAIPEHASSGPMSFVRGRTRGGLIGGSYGEIFFASGAGTRGAANTAQAGKHSDDASPGASGAPGTGGSAGSSTSSGGGNSAGKPDLPANASSTAVAATSGESHGAEVSAANSSGNGGVKPLAIPVKQAAVNPEPSTWVLFGTALFALLAARSRQLLGRV